MRNPLAAICLVCLALPATSRGDDSNAQAALQDVGAVLAWRLGPEAVEEWCRDPDPAGVAVRQTALQGWLEKNDERIKAVDARIAEVVPLMKLPSGNADPVEAVRQQVKALIFESLFAGKDPEETKAICKAEADPAAARWNSTGMPKIQISLSALYDWQTTRQK